MGWKDGLNVSVRSYSQSHIDVDIIEENNEEQWRLTRFYGNPTEHSRKETWELLKQLKTNPDVPWLVLGISMKFYFLSRRREEEFGMKDR